MTVGLRDETRKCERCGFHRFRMVLCGIRKNSGYCWYDYGWSMEGRIGFRCHQSPGVVVARARLRCCHPPKLSESIKLCLEVIKSNGNLGETWLRIVQM